jgi:hypothetical protein
MTGDGREFTYFSDPQVDRVVSLVWQLAQELNVTRHRLLVLEEILYARGQLPARAIDTMALSDDAAERLAADRQAMASRLVRTLTETDDRNAPLRDQFAAQLENSYV